MELYLSLVAIPLVVLIVWALRRLSARGKARAITAGFLTVNIGIVIAVVVLMLTASPAAAQETGEAADAEPATEEATVEQAAPAGPSGGAAIGAGLATGLAAIGAGIAVAITGSAAIGGITQKPEILGRTLIFVGLAEGIAIYGLIISFMILTGAAGG
jgi:V/A-type H+-transporting ATPase subunit K